MANGMLTVGTWSWSVEDDCCFADAVTAALFGIDPSDAARGLPVHRFLLAIRPQDRPSVESAIARAVTAGGPFACEYRVDSAYGVRQVMASGQCFRAPRRGSVFSGHVIDITEQVHQSALLEHLGTLIEQALNDATRARLPLIRYMLEMAYLELNGADQTGFLMGEEESARRH